MFRKYRKVIYLILLVCCIRGCAFTEIKLDHTKFLLGYPSVKIWYSIIMDEDALVTLEAEAFKYEFSGTSLYAYGYSGFTIVKFNALPFVNYKVIKIPNMEFYNIVNGDHTFISGPISPTPLSTMGTMYEKVGVELILKSSLDELGEGDREKLVSLAKKADLDSKELIEYMDRRLMLEDAKGDSKKVIAGLKQLRGF